MIDFSKIKVSGGNSDKINTKDLIWDSVPNGAYPATLVTVYPWKTITKDAKVCLRDKDGRRIKDDSGKLVTDVVKDLTWAYTDSVWMINEGAYKGHAIKGSLSTHPDFVGNIKQLMFHSGLFDVPADELYKNTGVSLTINVKTRTDSFKDKNTGEDVTKDVSYVSYYSEKDEYCTVEDIIDGI